MKSGAFIPAAALAILLGMTLLPAQAASSGGGKGTTGTNYAALAISDKTRAYGYSVNQPNRKAAERVALRECRKFASDCEIRTWTTKCLAFARAKGGAWGYSWRPKRFAARSAALRGCRKHSRSCRVEFATCNRGA